MRQRCTNSNRPEWGYYGGRGIGVCAEWDDFEVFLEEGAAVSEPVRLQRG